MLRVVKLGGSLLLRPSLRDDVTSWLERQSEGVSLFVVGGGEIIDAVRRLDAVHKWEPRTTHWQCVRLLQNTFEFAVSLFSQWQAIQSEEELLQFERIARSAPSTFVVNPIAFYNPNSDFDLPQSWDTTTDSIAGALAIRLRATELVLLKSCNVPNVTMDQLINDEIIDKSFAKVHDKLASLRIERLN